MPTPVAMHATCPRCGADVPGLAPGERRPCPYCKTVLAMPRLDPTSAEMPRVAVASVAAPRSGGGGCVLAAVLGFIGLATAGGIGAAVWAQQGAQAETNRQVNVQIEAARRAQDEAFARVREAQRQAQGQADDMVREQRQAACELRIRARCERECHQRPAKCDECTARERLACAAR